MDTPDDATKAALATLGAGPAAHELYKDALQPSAKVLGGDIAAVAKTIHHLLAPLRIVVWGFDRVEAWVTSAMAQKLQGVPEDNLRPPDTYLAGQILLQLPLCAEQSELRELYANLLAAAMRKDLASEVHPAFVQVVQQLTPDEALILREIAKRHRELRKQGVALPMVLPKPSDGAFKHPEAQFAALCQQLGLASADRSDAYLDNLLRLRLLADHRNIRDIYVSPFGQRFLKACLPEEPPPG